MRAHRSGKERGEDGVFVIEASRIKRSFVANRTEGWKVSSFVRLLRFSSYSFLFSPHNEITNPWRESETVGARLQKPIIYSRAFHETVMSRNQTVFSAEKPNRPTFQGRPLSFNQDYAFLEFERERESFHVQPGERFNLSLEHSKWTNNFQKNFLSARRKSLI